MDNAVNGGESKELVSVIKGVFETPDKDINEYSPLALAFIGDAVYEVVIRTVIINKVKTNVNQYHKSSTSFVKAQSQVEMYNGILPLLTEEEITVFKRGRNANIHSKAKNANISDYRKATGFEALMGYLYLTGQTDRMVRLIKEGIETVDNK